MQSSLFKLRQFATSTESLAHWKTAPYLKILAVTTAPIIIPRRKEHTPIPDMATSAENMIEEMLIALEDGAEIVVSATEDVCISLYATTKIM